MVEQPAPPTVQNLLLAVVLCHSSVPHIHREERVGAQLHDVIIQRDCLVEPECLTRPDMDPRWEHHGLAVVESQAHQALHDDQDNPVAVTEFSIDRQLFDTHVLREH
eukprot:CAMPEP_0115515274 /NCGR_PEP_ID=MMETSP0271-20121206/76128_1 /TAXON_ID=71861 /ORGANISM="Scrippsiella trochoidea, Strain CCMP3099" /LENGTH=106 /DNA_ID=CAMNT_0002945833 /DNA_START=71 /DNA_END=391 /DNA_ORIENTATION=+